MGPEALKVASESLFSSFKSAEESCQILTTLRFVLFGDSTTSDHEPVVSEEQSQLRDDVVNEEFIEADEELGTQVLMQEVDESEAPDLSAILVVPRGQVVEVESFAHSSEDVSE